MTGMAPIPTSLMWTEVAVDLDELLAHRRGTAVPYPKPDDRRSTANLPADRYRPRCDTDRDVDEPHAEPVYTDALRAMSAHTADQLEAEACDHDRCFGPALAAPPPEWRTLGARPPARPKARARR